MSNENKYVVSASPHIVSENTTQRAMLDVIIALLPALIAGWYFFGLRVLVLVTVCVCSAVVAEFVYQWLYFGIKIKSEQNIPFSQALSQASAKSTINDLSAVVTGILLAFNLPVTMPLWMAIIGSVFAIVIVKQLFGGIGNNFVNPALSARAFLIAAWPGFMTGRFIAPFGSFAKYVTVDVVPSPTPLSIIKETGEAATSLLDAFLGNVGGCIGEVSTLAILIGAIYLLVRRVIDLRIPLAYLLSFAVLTFFFGTTPYSIEFVLLNMCTGGLMLGAWFMATDYVTSPVTKGGHIVFGIGCGIITFAIRRFGGYPEGATYAILLMNIASPLIDKLVRPRVFGEVKKRG